MMSHGMRFVFRSASVNHNREIAYGSSLITSMLATVGNCSSSRNNNTLFSTQYSTANRLALLLPYSMQLRSYSYLNHLFDDGSSGGGGGGGGDSDNKNNRISSLLITIDELPLYQKLITHEMSNGNYEYAIQLLEKMDDYIESQMPLYKNDAESSTNLTLWKVYVLCHLTSCYFSSPNRYDQAFEAATKLLQMEAQCKQYNLLDHVFNDLNFACAIKADIYSLRGEQEKALKLLNFVIDSRIRKRLKLVGLPIDQRRELKFTLSEVLNYRGRVHSILDNYEKALKDLTESISLNNKDPKTYHSRGRVYLAAADSIHAKQDIDDALARCTNEYMREDPTLKFQIQLLLADYLIFEERFEEAEQVASECLSQGYCTYDSYYARARANAGLSRYEQSIADCYQALEKYSDKYDCYFLLVSCLFKLGKYDEAVQLAQRLLDQTNKDDEVYKSLQLNFESAQYFKCMFEGRYSRALFILQAKMLPQIRDSPFVNMYLCEEISTLLACEYYKEALETAERAVAQQKDQSWDLLVDLVAMRAVAFSYSNQQEDAIVDIEWCENELSLQSKAWEKHLIFKELLSRFLFAKAIVYSRDENRKHQSIELFEQALQNARDAGLNNVTVLDILANRSRTERELGLESDANKHLEEALAICPNHEVYSKWLK